MGGGPLINVFLRSILTFIGKARILIFAYQNRVRSMFFEFFADSRGGGTPDKRIPEGVF